MSKPTLAIIQFPGSNCEYEALEAVQFYGFDARISRWNDDDSWVKNADAYIVPGGFSFQDRIRAGAIAAKLPIMSVLQDADAKGKPILGICNGCQILAEAGFFPNSKGDYQLEAAMAPNTRDNKPVGFICDWVFVKPVGKPNMFTAGFSKDDVLPIPINHGEGRFVFRDELPADTTRFVYCSSGGQEQSAFPVNPNGAQYNTAGISNTKGNVMAIMPHPERAAFLKQIPFSIKSSWSARKQASFTNLSPVLPGPWAPLFHAMLASVRETV